MKKRILMILAPGFEELEAISVADILRRSDFEVVAAGLESRAVTGSHGFALTADRTLAETGDESFDAVYLPGGLPGATHLYASDAVVARLRRTVADGGIAAAICAAPIVLAKAGLLKGRRFTMYPGFDRYLDGALSTGELAETDGQVVTGKGPGAVFAFAAELVKALGGDVTELYRGMFVRI